MSQMEVYVYPLGAPGSHQLVFNVDSLPDQLQQGQLATLQVQWDIEPYRSLAQTPAVAAPASEVVGLVGTALAGLLASHPNTSLALQKTKSSQPPDRGIRVTIYNNAEDAHRIPWELLRSQTGFLSLEERIPIVRVAPDARERPDGVIIDRRLKLIVILGAVGIDCRPEWQALQKALKTWTRNLEVLVLTYDDALRQEINAAPESRGVVTAVDGNEVTRRLRAEVIPGSPEALMQQISNEAPHLCHFFCHGSANAQGQLEIGHRGTAEFGDAPLYLERHHLGQLGNSAWLMVLNACESAGIAAPAPAADEGAAGAVQPGLGGDSRNGSFATALVGEGVPYVLGMRQKISSNIVPKFTFAFYDAIFEELNQCIGATGRFKLNLDAALIRGQDAICSHLGVRAQVCRQRQDWSLPVFYTRGKRFHALSLESGKVGSYEAAVQLISERAHLMQIREKFEEESMTAPGVIEGIGKRIAEIETKLGMA